MRVNDTLEEFMGCDAYFRVQMAYMRYFANSNSLERYEFLSEMRSDAFGNWFDYSCYYEIAEKAFQAAQRCVARYTEHDNELSRARADYWDQFYWANMLIKVSNGLKNLCVAIPVYVAIFNPSWFPDFGDGNPLRVQKSEIQRTKTLDAP